MIPEEHKTAVITNGLHFMRSISEAYGADKGMELWETIANTLDADVKAQIFFAMITGMYNDRVHIKGLFPIAIGNAVPCIKALRTWSKRDIGLRDAKNMYDRLKDLYEDDSSRASNEYLQVDHEKYHLAVQALRKEGFNV